ncbi:MAG: response regulator [Acidobacteriota bacterium]|nr:response regulator [Acidobacteriota bacterium]
MKSAQIVLIEDNPGDVFLFEMALKENGIPYELMRFNNGAEALLVLCASKQANAFVPDAILLDLNTPRSDGFAVLNKLRQFPRLSHVPVAVLTSSQASSDRHRAALQNVRFIQKAAHLDEFLATVGWAIREMLYAEEKGMKAPA